jgi:hypothetical protein
MKSFIIYVIHEVTLEILSESTVDYSQTDA